jgi:Cyclic nucleotide-binding domain
MSLSTLVINVAYMSLLASTLTRSVPRLRVFLIAAAVCFVVFGLMVGNWSIVGWNTLIGLMNGRQLVGHLRARHQTALSASDDAFRRRWFAELDPFDFASLWSMGEDAESCDERMIRAGAANDTTALVIEGTVDVHRNGQVTRLGAGSLVGEISFVAGTPATADVDAVGSVRVRQWSHERLRTLDQLNPAASRAFHRFIERDLTRKVLGASRAA